MEATLLVCGLYTVNLGLHIVVPGRLVKGYVCSNDGTPLQYKLNGLVVFLLEVAGFWYLLTEDQRRVLFDNYGIVVATCNVLGLLASFYFVQFPQIKGGEEPYLRAITKDQVDAKTGRLKRNAGITTVNSSLTKSRSWLLTFFLGRDFNPRIFGGVDVKMWLYLVGATGLGCNILSCLSAQQHAWGGKTSLAMTVYTSAFGWFLVEYLFGEEIHLYTYDIFAEKIGFKLAWGCLVFYPTCYNIGAFPLAKAAPGNDINSTQAAGTILLFFTGWVLTRGANMQKFFFRTQPESKTFLFGLVKQETIPGTRILVSGWWGVSRHLNYFGEIVQALALSLPGVLVGPPVYKWLALLYPLYYVALFIPRQFDDDELCAAKYGQDKWGEYKRRVPWRIVPFVW